MKRAVIETVIFLDDGGVMNDNALRGPQWQKLLGEFFPPLLGGSAQAWAEANHAVTVKLWQGPQPDFPEDVNYADYDRSYSLAWLRGMCERVGVSFPPEDESLELARQAADYVTPRVRAAYPGAVDAIKTLHHRGYLLHTASGESSRELAGYLSGMKVLECFGRLYGPDLVDTLKSGPLYYQRILADAGILPSQALFVDDSARAIAWASEVGANTILVGGDIASLADLPQALDDAPGAG